MVYFIVVMPIKKYKNGLELYELVFGIGELSISIWIYLGCSIVITLYCSIAITLRIFKVYRLGVKSVKLYANVLEVVTESSALYTIVIFTTSIMVLVSPRWGTRYAVAALLSVTGISPTWILARVVSGKARTDESWTMDTSPLDSDREVIEFHPNRHSTDTNESTAYSMRR
ncbi:hypothetical protein CYLTODRAFT_260367 [Cylindrobasidium torrendii FP15055 ss-10]|uniref:Uncharacterized protein n=1 Tax=Cylindrobasidium torrendii FP15055 ss-10 TaxID=1314674 RepID=A0A0D7BE39_9AGAR|nr:hypothetical protein CYLTODRAFT_260367 [Cylindrobasidium torrendii FP15055 ss-10]